MNLYYVYWAWRTPLGTVRATSLSAAFELSKRKYGRGVVVAEEPLNVVPPTITYL